MTNKPRSNGLTGKPSNNKGKKFRPKTVTISVRMPESLLESVREMAGEEGIKPNAFMVEGLSAWCVAVSSQDKFK